MFFLMKQDCYFFSFNLAKYFCFHWCIISIYILNNSIIGIYSIMFVFFIVPLDLSAISKYLFFCFSSTSCHTISIASSVFYGYIRSTSYDEKQNTQPKNASNNIQKPFCKGILFKKFFHVPIAY